MQVSWFSRQGDARRRNNDAAAVGFGETHLIAVLVDDAEKGTGGAALVPPVSG